MSRKLALGGGLTLVLIVSMVLVTTNWANGGPTVRAASVLRKREAFQRAGITLSPPASGFSPAISSDQAVRTAIDSAPLGIGTATLTPVLANISTYAQSVKTGDHLIQNVPAWQITADGVCVPVYGGGSVYGSQSLPPPGCASTELTVVISATTGKYLMAYTPT